MTRFTTRARIVAAIAAACIGSGAPAAGDGFELEGTWHVLIHYRDERAKDPDQWRWDDRIWELRRDGDQLFWVEYMLVHFVDESGRFTDLGTNRAARVPGAWEPNGRQQKQIETGLGVTTRSARHKRLERDPDGGWRNLSGATALAGLVEDGIYLSDWSIQGEGEHTVFQQTDSLRSGLEEERIGTVRYAATSWDANRRSLRGRYERDGARLGRFLMRPTQIGQGAAAVPDEQGRIRMQIPEEMKRVPGMWFALVRPWHYFGERLLQIRTVPPDAELHLSYLRRGTRLLYARTSAPATVQLPPRVSAGSHDVLQVLATASGRERQLRVVPVRSSVEEVQIDLEPLPNRVVGVEQRSLAGRGAITLTTIESATARSRRTVEEFQIVLLGTGLDEGAAARLRGFRSRYVGGVDALSVGSDLLLTFHLTREAREAGVDIRTLRGEDPVRVQHWLVLDWSVPADRAAWPERVRAGLAALAPDDVRGCSLVFEETLRRSHGDGRALGSNAAAEASFLRPVYRATLRRLGDLAADTRLELADGSRLDPADPLELELALQRAPDVSGYVAALRALIRELEPDERRDTVLRGLLAPGAEPGAFAAALATADQAEDGCRSARSQRE